MTTPIPAWIVMGTRPAALDGLSIVTVGFGPGQQLEIVVPTRNIATKALDLAIRKALERRQSTIEQLAPGGE